MKKVGILGLILIVLNLNAQTKNEQKLATQWLELTAPELITAVEKSKGVAILPIAIIEKHGAHMPLGTDIYFADQVAKIATEKEYAVVFPTSWAGQINEARHQPGTICYSPKLIWDFLQETLDEMSRNGFKKIIILNGHGGNVDFLRYFTFSQLNTKKDYVVLYFTPTANMMRAGHADCAEASMIKYSHPNLVKDDLANTQSGEKQKGVQLPNQYTGIWWYAIAPNHYLELNTTEKIDPILGKKLYNDDASELAELIKQLKVSNQIEELQNKFFEGAENPLKTKQ
jgi:creatinine amidohydrolase